MFIRIEVIRPAILFKKLGLPHAMICRIMLTENLGTPNRSSVLPRKKGYSAISAQINMPEQVARAAPQTPQPKTPRNKNSNMALSAESRMFKNMLPRMNPQMRRKLSVA